jgi:hypothetical protein
MKRLRLFVFATLCATSSAVVALPSSATAAGAQNRNTHRAKPPSCSTATTAYTVCKSSSNELVFGGIQDAIQSAVLGFAKDQLKGFLINQFGLGAMLDPTGTKLDAISQQLEQISAQVAQIQTSLNNTYALITQVDLHTLLVPLTQDVTSTFSLYNTYFAPMIRAEIAYATASKAVPSGSTCKATPACSDAQDNFDTARGTVSPPTGFLGQEDESANSGLNDQIHSFLVPTPGKPSVINAYGKYLMTNGNGFLTTATSAQVLGFYAYFADTEALATWMKAEWNGVRYEKNLPEFDRFLVQTLTGDPASNPPVASYFDEELMHVPPPIPAGVVVSLDANASLRTTSQNRPMWLVSNAKGANLIWSPYDPTGSRSVGAAINALNNTKVAGFSDWAVPTKAVWDSLFSGWKIHDNLLHFLQNMNRGNNDIGSTILFTSLGLGSYVWTATPSDFIVSVRFAAGLTIPLHTGLVLSGNDYTYPAGNPLVPISNGLPSICDYPGSLTKEQATPYCLDKAKATLGAYVPGNQAALIATRSTGSVSYMGEQ